jgi:thioesterase domain-containing protein/acyl carrier protein
MRIEPGDVESVLVRHPGVGSAAVFAAGAGDDRGLHAAVTARADLDLEALRRFAAEELPQHMVPRRIVVMDVMPLNSSGKLDRKAVAATAQARAPDATVPAVTLDSTLLDIWQSLLGSRPVDPETDFFDAGGHSILALRLVTEVERRLGVSLPLSLFFEGDATVARISAEVRERVGGRPAPDPMRDRVPVVTQGTGPLMLPFSGERLGAPLFVVCPHAGAALATRRIASVIATERHPVFALSPQWDDSTILERVIDQMVIMVASDGRDRVHLAGHSLGGVVAYEMAGRLAQRGIEVGMLCLVDTVSPEMMRAHKPLLRRRIRVALGIPVFWRRMPPPAPPGEAWELGAYGFPFDRASALVRRHRVRPQNRRIDLLVTETSTQRFGDSLGWEQVHQGPIVRTPIPGDHVGVMRPPHVTALARILAERIRCAELPPAT